MATILIVDDHVLNREFLMTLLGYGGHRLLEAADGVEGLASARAEYPDLIIADILMPNMDGYEFVTNIHADPSIAHIPIIFYTAAFREREAKVMALACGVRWVLPKPSDPEVILQTVQEALKLPPATAVPPVPPLLAPEGKRFSGMDRHFTEYLDKIDTKNLMSPTVHDGEENTACTPEDLQQLTQRLSKSLSNLQAVSLRLTALIDLGIELAAERDSALLIEVGCRVVHNVCVAKYAVIGILADDDEQLIHFATHGLDDTSRAQLGRPLSRAGMLRGLLEARIPQRMLNLGGAPQNLGLPASHPPIHSFLGVAIASRERTYGWLYLADKLGDDEFSEIDERAAATVAAQLAVAYENLVLYEKIRQQHEQLCMEMCERKRHEDRIEYLANHDALTDLANRNLLGDRITQAMHQTRRTGGMLALLFLDLDRFKEINDSCGHACGDALLKAVANRLQKVVREGDTVARQGGDEFIVLLTNVQEVQSIVNVAEKIIEAFSKPFMIGNRHFYTTTSIGATVYPDDSDDLQTLLQNADTAMYRAKAENGNKLRLFSRDMSERAMERAALESALRQAIEHQQFELFYQPKVSLADGHICGAEALIRWHHPEKGMISPVRFIPLAEEAGLIVPIGEWVSRTACLQNKAWQQAGLPPICVAVNLSARQFRQAEFVPAMADALRESRLEAHYLELELTESMVMNSAEQFIEKLHDLKAMGVRLSIDDFGTGYSSLSYLKRFPIDSLKIDQSFVRDIVTDPDDAAITRSVISLGHSLNLKVIAEGVETKEQLTYLRHHCCDEIQGYYVSQPVPADQFARMLQQR